MKAPEIVGGREDGLRPRAGEGGEEEGVRFVPGIAKRVRVENLESRRTALHPQHARGTEGRKGFVAGDVLPEIAEILRAHAVPVRPAHPPPKVQREAAPLLDLVAFEEIRDQLEVPVVGDEARVAIHHEHAHVLLPAHEHSELPAVAPDFATRPAEFHDARPHGHALGNGGERTRRYRFPEVRGFDVVRGSGRACKCEHAEQRSQAGKGGSGALPPSGHLDSKRVLEHGNQTA